MGDEKTFTAADVLLYLFSDCVKWSEDVDGDAREDGSPYAIVNHDIRLTEQHLEELLDMAGISRGHFTDGAKVRLERAIDADLAKR